MAPDLMPGIKTPSNNNQIISYYALRVLIGATGILLPFLLILGKLISENSFAIEFSVSDYYDNGTAGDVLVGILFVLGFFLMTYKGHEKIDSRTANFGCVFALGVALCPTTSSNNVIHIMHFVFALLLFSVFIFFSIYLFRKTGPGTCTKQKDKRNKIYFTCGIIMILCIVGIALSMLAFEATAQKYQLVFWFESVALIAFGFSWITKAELVLKDEGK